MLENDISNDGLKEEKCTCYKCGNTYDKSEMNIYKIQGRNYTSYFYWTDVEIPLCDKCKKFMDVDWFDNDKMIKDDMTYNCEDELQLFINTFPIEFQEKVYNQGIIGELRLEAEEWINNQLNIENNHKRKEWSDEEVESIKEYYSNLGYAENL